jgi:hypothetical protein
MGDTSNPAIHHQCRCYGTAARPRDYNTSQSPRARARSSQWGQADCSVKGPLGSHRRCPLAHRSGTARRKGKPVSFHFSTEPLSGTLGDLKLESCHRRTHQVPLENDKKQTNTGPPSTTNAAQKPVQRRLDSNVTIPL